jgi:hypothetical protein
VKNLAENIVEKTLVLITDTIRKYTEEPLNSGMLASAHQVVATYILSAQLARIELQLIKLNKRK